MHRDTWARAACAPENRSEDTKDLDWFSSNQDKKYKARMVCQTQCPIRKECIQYALDSEVLHGIWGGVDDYELRRARSVDSLGDPLSRNRAPRCPFCMSRKLSIGSTKTKHGYRTECLNEGCGLTWYMATVPAKQKGKRAA